MRHCPFKTSSKLYEDYYGIQSGRGLPVFVGGRNYRGHGLGSLLAGIGGAVVPLLKTGGKALLKEGARTGMQVAQDVLSGENLKTSFKQRAGQAGKRLFDQAIDHATRANGPARKRIKRTRSTKRRQLRRQRRRDIFG